jgi:xylulokinase
VQLLGIDIGTSSVKGLIIESNGRTVAHSSIEHNLSSPHPGWAEESPDIWWENTLKVIRNLLVYPTVKPDSIVGIGITGMVPALVILGKNGALLRPSMMQTDARAATYIKEVKEKTSKGYIFSMTGANLSQQSIGPKLLWLQRNEPKIWAQTDKVMGSYDYINYRLTGAYSLERNWALESGLYDINRREWSPEILSFFKTQVDMLPEIHDPSDIIGCVREEVAKLTGLPSGIPVVAGTADHIGAAFAAGIIDDGDLLIKFGSAGDILYSTGVPLVDSRLFIDYHIYPGKYMVNGCMTTSGSFIKWLVQQFFQEDVAEAIKLGQDIYAYLDKYAEDIPAGSEGLIILPYFLGEKTPIFDPSARGVFFGMTLYHKRYHIYRAALESVVYGFRHHIEVLKERGNIPKRVVAGEGGARSQLWRQIAADTLNMPVAYLKDNPGASLAAAFVAGMGVNAFQSWRDIERFVNLQDLTQPNPENVSVYDRCFERYLALYESLREDFRKI